jgi:hypothetical protein
MTSGSPVGLAQWHYYYSSGGGGGGCCCDSVEFRPKTRYKQKQNETHYENITYFIHLTLSKVEIPPLEYYTTYPKTTNFVTPKGHLGCAHAQTEVAQYPPSWTFSPEVTTSPIELPGSWGYWSRDLRSLRVSFHNVTSGQKAPLGRILCNFRLRMRTHKGTPSGLRDFL